MTTTAGIAAKGCTGTGITESIAKRLHDNLGQHIVAVVELVAESRAENRGGDEKVVLNILTIEPAERGLVEDYLRNMQQALHYERKVGEDGLQLQVPGDDAVPSIKDVIAQGAGVLGEGDDGQPMLLTDPEDSDTPDSDDGLGDDDAPWPGDPAA